MSDEEIIAEVLERKLLIAHEVRGGAQLWEIPRALIPPVVGTLNLELDAAVFAGAPAEGNA